MQVSAYQTKATFHSFHEKRRSFPRNPPALTPIQGIVDTASNIVHASTFGLIRLTGLKNQKINDVAPQGKP
jgi:hypothetical protein